MEQDILRSRGHPRVNKQAFSPLGCFLAAMGAGLLTLMLTGAAAVASAWAFSRLLGFPDTVMYGIAVVVLIPVVWASLWTGLRAWHVEQRLAQHLDIDAPVYKIGHYLRRSA
ncbi:MAG: hypothetical protein U1E15_07480 [Hyphomicrobiales bacterium]